MVPFSLRQDDALGQALLKRRLCAAPSGEGRAESTEEPLAHLSKGIKRIRIAKGCSGQLRLKRDVEEIVAAAPWLVEIDQNEPLVALVTVGSTLLFRIQVGRFYPNAPPVVTDGAGRLIRLSVLEAWRPVFTLSNVLENLMQVSMFL